MQAPRNWRMKQQRYRLEETQDADGTKSIVGRPAPLTANTTSEATTEDVTVVEVNAA
ncbi:MAG: hypothetical protein AAFR67_14545 [Chloroflexota bacterium]